MSESGSELVIELRPPLPEKQPNGDPDSPQSWKSRLLQSVSGLKRRPLAVLVIGLPLSLTFIYECFIASDIYVSEAHFIVRSKAMSASLKWALRFFNPTAAFLDVAVQ